MLQPLLLDPGLNGTPVLVVGFLAVAFVVGGLFGCYRSFDRYRRGVRVWHTPTEFAHSVAMGRTALEGTGTDPRRRLVTPFGTDDCLFAYWEVFEWAPEEDDSRRGLVDNGIVHTDFRLADDTGSVRLSDPVEAFLRDTRDDALPSSLPRVAPVWPYGEADLYQVGFTNNQSVYVVVDEADRTALRVGPDETPPSHVVRWCRDHGIDPDPQRHREYVRYVLPVGTPLYVRGGAQTTDDGADVILGRDGADGQYVLSSADPDTLYGQQVRRSAKELLVAVPSTAIGLYLLLGLL